MIEYNPSRGFSAWLDNHTALESTRLSAQAADVLVSELGIGLGDAVWFLNSPDGEAFAADLVCRHFDNEDSDIETTMRQVLTDWHSQPDDYCLYTAFNQRGNKPYWSALQYLMCR